jgi:hypothetical protein
VIQDYESGLEKEVAGLKLQGVEALKRQDYLAASDLYTKVYNCTSSLLITISVPEYSNLFRWDTL